MTYADVILKKGEDKRVRALHPWIYSNEINVRLTPLNQFQPGAIVRVLAHDKRAIGIGYINPHSLICIRLLTLNVAETIDDDFFLQRIKSALQFREALFPDPYYRLFFAEADGLPGLVIDRYGQDFVVQLNTAGMDVQADRIARVLQTCFPQLQSILLRNDSKIREQENLPLLVQSLYGKSPDTLTIKENSVKFTLPLLEGQKTGWFFDQRLNRARLRDFVDGKSVLDLFSYLGGFGIQAAVFGAMDVTCVEESSFASAFIQRNAEDNHVSKKVSVLTMDAFAALKSLAVQNKQFDVIIVDPPAFVKKAKDKTAGLLAYQRINTLALSLLNQQGILVSCSCSMQVSMQDLEIVLRQSARKTNLAMQIIGRGTNAPDHPIHLSIPETDYLKAIFLRRRR